MPDWYFQANFVFSRLVSCADWSYASDHRDILKVKQDHTHRELVKKRKKVYQIY